MLYFKNLVCVVLLSLFSNTLLAESSIAAKQEGSVKQIVVKEGPITKNMIITMGVVLATQGILNNQPMLAIAALVAVAGQAGLIELELGTKIGFVAMAISAVNLVAGLPIGITRSIVVF